MTLCSLLAFTSFSSSLDLSNLIQISQNNCCCTSLNTLLSLPFLTYCNSERNYTHLQQHPSRIYLVAHPSSLLSSSECFHNLVFEVSYTFWTRARNTFTESFVMIWSSQAVTDRLESSNAYAPNSFPSPASDAQNCSFTQFSLIPLVFILPLMGEDGQLFFPGPKNFGEAIKL